MRAWCCPALVVLGFGLMLLAYYTRSQPDPDAPWANGLIVTGSKETTKQPSAGLVIQTRLRVLPGNELTETIVRSLIQVNPPRLLAFE
jgi:hypothetical protein